jgi:hypothetical protein
MDLDQTDEPMRGVPRRHIGLIWFVILRAVGCKKLLKMGTCVGANGMSRQANTRLRTMICTFGENIDQFGLTRPNCELGPSLKSIHGGRVYIPS